MKDILVTGGVGYIGSHTCVALMSAGYRVTILDNFVNSDAAVIDRIHNICGSMPELIEGDIRERELLDSVFRACTFYAVIHFAGLKAVGDSVKVPLEYYDNNVMGSLSLLNAMQKARVKRFVFSSSATVYGDPASVPICENFPRSATNPYGRSKIVVEDILSDLHRSDPEWHIACLRYFNPVGAHESGLIGEDPKGTPNNLMPYICQVAIGQRDQLAVLGDDYPTRDGTGIRDYIHVVDLADGHVAALAYLETQGGLLTVNLGTGKGHSVFEVIRSFEKASGRKISYKIVDRRPGDIAQCWALPSKAERLLGWKAAKDIDDMCADAWRWAKIRAGK